MDKKLCNDVPMKSEEKLATLVDAEEYLPEDDQVHGCIEKAFQRLDAEDFVDYVSMLNEIYPDAVEASFDWLSLDYPPAVVFYRGVACVAGSAEDEENRTDEETVN